MNFPKNHIYLNYIGKEKSYTKTATLFVNKST